MQAIDRGKIHTVEVAGSNPAAPTMFFPNYIENTNYVPWHGENQLLERFSNSRALARAKPE
jgi:hypothetical protein